MRTQARALPTRNGVILNKTCVAGLKTLMTILIGQKTAVGPRHPGQDPEEITPKVSS